jgi:energy-coupling factor transporter transmembrane protein EcfT
LLINAPEGNIALVGISILLISWAKLELRFLVRCIPLITSIGLFMALFVILFPNPALGTSEITVGFLHLNCKPLFLTFVAYIRVIAMIVASLFYFSTNPESDFIVSLRTLRVPFTASYTTALGLRAAGLFLEDFHIIGDAEKSRGLNYSGANFIKRIYMYAMRLVPLFIISLRRIEEISLALSARGFTLERADKTITPRSDYVRQRHIMHLRDWLAICLILVICVTLSSIFSAKAELIAVSPIARSFFDNLNHN